MEQTIGIYVLPTVAGAPPRAVLFDAQRINNLAEQVIDSDQGREDTAETGEVSLTSIAYEMSTWSADMGCWVSSGVPLPEELSEALTARAKDLGVEWD